MDSTNDLLLSLLLLEFDDESLDNEYLLLLFVALEKSQESEYDYLQAIGDHLNFNKLDEETCLCCFRFTKEQIVQLYIRLGLPALMSARSHHMWSGLEGLLIVLRRLVYPNHLGGVCQEFGRSKPAISITFNTILFWLHNRWDGLLTDPFTKLFFPPGHIDAYWNVVR